MDSTQPTERPAQTTTTTTPPTLTASRMAVRTDKSTILEMPKLVPVTDPKPTMESVLKKSVTSSSLSGQQNLIKVLPRTIPIKTVQGPNGNLLVHGPHNKIVSLQIKNASGSPTGTTPLSLLPISLSKDAKTAMLKFSGVTSIQARKIQPKESAPLPVKNFSNEIITTTKLPKEILTTAKLPTKEATLITKSISKEIGMSAAQCAMKELVKNASPSSESQTIFKSLSKEPTTTSTTTSATAPKLTPIMTTLPTTTATTTSAAAPKLTPIMTTLPTTTSTVINTLVTSKTLEIKPITVTNSPKALTPAQAATVPITQITATNLFSKLCSIKSDTNEETVTIEKKIAQKLQHIKTSVPKKESTTGITAGTTSTTTAFGQSAVTFPTGNRMISLQISNGKLSDPNGPIKLISANHNKIREQKNKAQEVCNTSNPDSSKELESSTSSENNSTVSSTKTSRQNSQEKSESENSGQQDSKTKQQSLLRHKIIETLQRSPRTKARSKSLTALNQKFNLQKRRMSAASDGDIRKPVRGNKSKSSSPPASTTPPEAQVKKLLCPEKISTSSDSLCSTSPIEGKVSSVPVSYSSSEVIEMNSSDDDDCKLVLEDNVAISKINDNEIYGCLSWSEGVGSLKDSRLQFQFNEFGLIEIVDSKRAIKRDADSTYEKPIFERESKSQKTLDYSNPYHCKGCHCKGAAVDFLTPEFCSRECIRRYNGRMSSGVATKHPKKYTNRKRPASDSDDIKEDVFEMKPESSNLHPGLVFSWDSYLTTSHGEPTPIDLFLNPFPCSSNMFQIGMKLEAIDPEHSTLFCVCTIVEKKGYRLKLHFDGYSKFYDFWVNADSMDIFPPGWCAKTNRVLQPPRGISPLSFNWPMYLNRTKALPAPRNLFTHLNASSQNHGFKVGMKIEADDLRNSGKVCVATIADILDNRLLIHFDGWDDSYSYWIDISSPYIHPVNWHKKNGFSIVPPPECQQRFSWGNYLMETRGHPVAEDMLRTRDPIEFKSGMKLEVVDKRNTALIRPASVIMTDDYEIKVLFEGWPMEYAFWIEDDSPDIHPIGWCEITNHDLEPPPGFDRLPTRYDCNFPGCRGIGNALHPELEVHTNIKSCPYEPSNWTKEIDKTGRLNNFDKYPSSAVSELKPKELISRHKRKSEHFPRPPVFAKIPKQVHPILIQHPPPLQMQKPTIATVSLLSPKEEKPEQALDTRINIARHLLCDYGPRLQQVYTLWKRNSECLTVNLTESQTHGRNPLEWSILEVAEYISKLPRCQTVAQEFIRQDIDGQAFLSMRQCDLTEIMQIKLGPAIKIYNQIVQLREDVVTRFMSNNLSKVS